MLRIVGGGSGSVSRCDLSTEGPGESNREDSRSGAEEKDVGTHSVSYMTMINQSESSEKVFESRTIEYKMTMLIRSEPSIYPRRNERGSWIGSKISFLQPIKHGSFGRIDDDTCFKSERRFAARDETSFDDETPSGWIDSGHQSINVHLPRIPIQVVSLRSTIKLILRRCESR